MQSGQNASFGLLPGGADFWISVVLVQARFDYRFFLFAPTVREVGSSQLVDVIAKPSRIDDVLPDFSRLSTGQKPVSTSLDRTLNRVINSLTIEWLDNITTAYFTSITWNMISSGDSNFSSLEFSAEFFVAPAAESS